ncbi:MAG: HAMP domain-containing sensor histidine kinase [Bacteroidales bacterium]|nr:HAMP domain-containing sensor histidine kinase [Bacteroidales bacterium]
MKRSEQKENKKFTLSLKILSIMDIYNKKRQWKFWLLIGGLAIVLFTTLATNFFIGKIQQDERRQVKIWANTVQQKAEMVNYTDHFFNQLRDEECRKVELLAECYKRLLSANDEELTFFTNIIANNNTIPVILTESNYRIIIGNNLDFKIDTVKYLKGDLLKEFSEYEPIRLNYLDEKYQYLFYKNSILYSELHHFLSNLTQSFFDEAATNMASVPVIITDSLKTTIYATGNIDHGGHENHSIEEILEHMESENDPIIVDLGGQGKRYIYYSDSDLLMQIRLFPFIQLLILLIFVFFAYVLFSFSRNAEQNQVWAGMAKETAHQLGTPISSIMAWVELLKMNEDNKEIAEELGKDVNRLDVIADRFSKIGSLPELTSHDVVAVMNETLTYLRKRISGQIQFKIQLPDHPIIIPMNPQLFSWGIENLTKNAADAMSGTGVFGVEMKEEEHQLIIDISDTGKGISRQMRKQVFRPGFTTKKRGWGLGLSFVKRIMQDYHHGKIFIKSTIINEGTTFRIILNK